MRSSPALLSLAALLALPAPGVAGDVSVVGLFPGKAVLIVDDASPKTYAVGANIGNGMKLVAADQNSATLEIDGKRQVLGIGDRPRPSSASSANGAKVVLHADGRGHFFTDAQLNGIGVKVMVDTGATSIAIPAQDALRMGLDYRKGQPAYVSTANGMTAAYRVKLNTVKIGDIEVNQVDALVLENGLSSALLGMSFLNRTQMQRDGDQMILTKRF